MSHDAIEFNAKPEVDKASLLQPLAVQEIEETHSLNEAQLKADRMIETAELDAKTRLDSLPEQLNELENQILEQESAQGQKEALEIQIHSEKQLTENIKTWEPRVDQAVANLVKRVLEVDA